MIFETLLMALAYGQYINFVVVAASYTAPFWWYLLSYFILRKTLLKAHPQLNLIGIVSILPCFAAYWVSSILNPVLGLFLYTYFQGTIFSILNALALSFIIILICTSLFAILLLAKGLFSQPLLKKFAISVARGILLVDFLIFGLGLMLNFLKAS